MKKLNEIKEAIRLCENQNRKPLLILMNLYTQKDIIEKEEWIYISGGEHVEEKDRTVTSLFGLPVMMCNVKDFLIIDDKHWYEQKF